MAIREELELEKLRAEISQLSASTQKTLAEIKKIERERVWIPAVAIASLAAALLAFLRVIS